MKVFQAMHAVASDLAKTGVEKTGWNQQQQYKFRGIDAFLDALSPVMSRHGLIVVPRYREPVLREVGKTAKDAAIFEAVIVGDFDFIAAEDGSKHTATVPGQGRDSADKAINKAMSAAYKYAMVQSFCIPFQGMQDSEEEPGHAVMPEEHIDQAIKAMREAATLDALKKVYIAAVQVAQGYNDASAKGAFDRAKDERKAKLESVK